MNYYLRYLIFLTLGISASSLQSQEHPKLILTKQGVENIRGGLGEVPLFDESLKNMKEEIDAEMASGIHMPIPEDYSGGYSHERPKKNFMVLQKAGVLYQILQEEKYAVYVRDMLFQYEAMYKTLPIHPKERSYARGKLFWQCLNDSNWLVYVSQAYDCIYDWLSEKERKKLEKNLFRPFADWISIENPQFYNRVHNHSTWGNVAVGMIALVMGDEDLLQRALYGLKDAPINTGEKDNDGGFIYSEDGKAGFFANLDEPFSPDGYYTEGPYYQRYAMYPFLIFAQALHNAKPELEIFGYKDSVLLKSVDALINLSDADGDFFPINDAQKGMSYSSKELVNAVDLAYHVGGNNPQLLDIAQEQERVVLNDAGLSVAMAIQNDGTIPFRKKSVELRDGADGTQGGVGILRKDGIELVFKYTAQGLSHGHYDKLSYSLYEDGNEVIQDYGLARFVNIEQKGGGNYLKENTTWAKQTVAHNTVVQDETSHFKGEYEIGSKHHSEKYIFNTDNPEFQVASAKEPNAYPGTEIHRTMAMITDSGYVKPYILDVIRLTSDATHLYDLPLYYMGQLIQVNFEYESPKTLEALGDSDGYQHLYKEGHGRSEGESMQLNWLNHNRFYTTTSVAGKGDEFILGRIGANDPEFNLRRDAAFIHRKKDAKDAVFVSIIEPHGTYSPVSELAVNAYSKVQSLEVLQNDASYTAVKIEAVDGTSKVFIVANENNSPEKEHQITISDKDYTWKGPYTFTNLK